jgi:hypothetical protein
VLIVALVGYVSMARTDIQREAPLVMPHAADRPTSELSPAEVSPY